jgi:hypothetical protein
MLKTMQLVTSLGSILVVACSGGASNDSDSVSISEGELQTLSTGDCCSLGYAGACVFPPGEGGTTCWWVKPDHCLPDGSSWEACCPDQLTSGGTSGGGSGCHTALDDQLCRDVCQMGGSEFGQCVADHCICS